MVKGAQTCSATDFLGQVQEPFLVGKELYDRFFANVLATDDTQEIPDPRAFRATTLGQAADQVTLTDTDGATHAIFVLCKKNLSSEHASVLSIGRDETNDIVIADHSVSRVHARIIEFRGMFFLIDLESTNGTKLHHQFITPNIKVRVESDSVITFGRLNFVFMTPYELYRGIRMDTTAHERTDIQRLPKQFRTSEPQQQLNHKQ